MTNKYIRFGGLTFGGESYIKGASDTGETEYTPYIFSELEPNGLDALSQKDDLLIDGSVYSNFRYDARIVSLRGHILPRRGEDIRQLRQRLYAEINGKRQTQLIYFDGSKKYFCNAIGDVPACAVPIKASVEFNINFTVPDSFWYEYNMTSIAVSKKTPNLTTTFTLPRVFSFNETSAWITNENEFDIYPVVRIISNAVTSSGSLTVENVTTGCKIILTGYAVSSGTMIEIDCKNMTAKCGRTNAINYFNDFSDFMLKPGKNQLKAYNNNNDSKFTAAIEFYRPYVGI